jgi:hypothetical protein
MLKRAEMRQVVAVVEAAAAATYLEKYLFLRNCLVFFAFFQSFL